MHRAGGCISLCLAAGWLLQAQNAGSFRSEIQPAREHENNARSIHRRAWFRDRYISYVERDGLAFAEGDMLLGDARSLRSAPLPGKDSGKPDASIIVGNGYRWPGNLIPYVIDTSGSRNPNLAATVQRAIEHWQSKTSYRFVNRQQQANYVVFSAKDSGCYSSIGMSGGPQVVNLEVGCLTGQAIHEIGHSVGFFHEQSRNDRDQFVTVLTDNITPANVFNFDKAGSRGADTALYDYNSIMHYEANAFSRNGKDVLATIPPGIPIGQRSGLSPADIDAAESIAGWTNLPYVIATNPPGLTVAVDGKSCVAPCYFPEWTAGSSHSITTAGPQNLPNDPIHAYYFARWNDAGAQSHAITANVGRRVITANFSTIAQGVTAPDLIVSSFSAPQTAAPGGKINISATVQNIGKQDASAFRFGVYISADRVIQPSDRYLAFCTIGSLAPGASYDCFGEITLPNDLPGGNYYIGGFADDQSQVLESDESNNSTANQNGVTLITSTTAAYPDLVVTSFTAPVTGTAGGVIANTRVEVRNRGLGASGGFRIGYYVSRSATYDSNAIYTTWSCTEGQGLPAGDTASCSGNIGLPANLPAGSYYLIAVVDDLLQVTESEESNNARPNDSGVFTVVPPPATQADLVVTTFTAAASGTIGQKLSNTVLEIRNKGTANAGKFRIGYYYSANAGVTTKDIFSGWACDIPEGLAANATTTCSGDIGIPTNLSPGQYNVAAIVDDLAEVDESDESNNSGNSQNGKLTLAFAASPDLTVTSFTAAVTGNIGQTIADNKATVMNQGTVAAGKFRIGYYWSTKSPVTVSDVFSGWSCTVSGGLAPGDSFSCTGEIGVPDSLAPGSYYLAAIVDDLLEVDEASEANNARVNDSGMVKLAVPTMPDLAVTSLTGPTSGTVGQNLQGARVQVKNQGNARAEKFRIGFYYSTASRT